MKGVFPVEVLSGLLTHMQNAPPRGSGGMLPQKILGFETSEMDSDALFK